MKMSKLMRIFLPADYKGECSFSCMSFKSQRMKVDGESRRSRRRFN